ncbi:MAG: class I tRNA ligase family protein, partial [Candidatus Woesebacteria bacterium]|nr:class I tRNA ligase family protein [Candidatus Woesebacteria bacterium]
IYVYMAKSRTFFEPVDLKVDFPRSERELLHDWSEQGVVKKYLSRNKKSKSYFSFLDGPITANNSMGVHHAWGRMYKDLWQRFKNMQGYRERFQNGFDCQGLWVEVEVEKELGFKNKKDIEKFGVAKFVQLCRDRVKKYSEIQAEQSKRLGYFMDWDNSYYTLSEDNNYMIWHFLKTCNDMGWIYKGNDVVAWCPRCETAISEHEILTEDYKEVTHESVFLSFPIVGQPDENLLAWTTTPWTVPANIALAIDGDTEYSLMEVDKKKYWVAKGTRDRVFAGVKAKELKVTRGSKLIGLRYIGAFDTLPAVKSGTAKNDKFHTVTATDPLILPIGMEEGTGIVHTSTGTGAEDHRFGKKIGLPVVAAIDDQANYLNGFGFLSGKNAKKDPDLVINYLKGFEGGRFLYKTMNYKHRYPSCWRCKTELVWKITDEWYIAMDKTARKVTGASSSKIEKWKDGEDEIKSPPDVRTLRERMKGVTEKINWIPGFGLDREMDWLTNMHDWLISKKNRYWGLALPIWECKKCHNFEVFGSKEELRQRAVEGWKGFDGKSPHKPQIDAVKIKCSKCGAEACRIEPVGNPWLDAGIVPFSTISENNKACGFGVSKTKPLYLTDRESWQKWFPADFITESFPGQFKNWFYAIIAMSTVLEDVSPVKTVLGFATMLDSSGRGFHKSLGNSIEFVEGADKAGADVIRWMCARQNPAENLQFGYESADEVRRKFHLKLWNIYNFFVTYANLDGWVPGTVRKPGRPSNILDKWILVKLNQTVCQVSGFLEKFDAVGAATEIEKFVDDFSLWYIRRSRDRVGPAKETETDSNAFYLTTHYTLLTLCKIMAPFTPFITDVIYTNLTKDVSVHLANWPEFTDASHLNSADVKLIEEMGRIRGIVEKIHAKRKESGIPVRQPLSKAKVYGQSAKISKEVLNLACMELNIKSIQFLGGSDKIELDTKITPELKEEAEVRELVRSVQEDRKKLGLNLGQTVDVTLEKIPVRKDFIEWMTKKAQIASLKQGKYKVVRSS